MKKEKRNPEKIFKIISREKGSVNRSPQEGVLDDKTQKSLEELAKNFITHFTHRENVSICLNEVVDVLGNKKKQESIIFCKKLYCPQTLRNNINQGSFLYFPFYY